jgi:arylsulfatase A-like enzyme
LRVPFLVVGPGIQAQRVSRVPVSGLDLLPTFAELAGQAGQDSPLLDGGSLVPLFKDPSLPQVQRDQEALFFHQGAHRKPRSALIKGRYKLIKYWSKESKYPHTPKVELFDLQTDLAETQDLATQFPELTAELTAELLHFLETTGAETRRLNIEDPFDRLVQETEGKSDP